MNKPYVYLAGDIMSHGSNLARQEEYDKVMDLNIDAEIYSPVKNKDINDKSMPGLSMEEKIEKNNHLAEEIVKQDCDRMWKANAIVMCPEQNAIGSLVEMGILYGWKTFSENIIDMITSRDNVSSEKLLNDIWAMAGKTIAKDIYSHYEDIRDTDIPEVGWRRSFSINQFLYGVVKYISKNKDFMSFDDICKALKEEYGEKNDGAEN